MSAAALTLADLPPERRDEGRRLHTQYHALLAEAGLLDAGRADLGKLEDASFVRRADPRVLRDIAQVQERLANLTTLDLPELRRFLQQPGVDGRSLESRLEGGSLDAQLEKHLAAFADGEFGFTPDLSELRVGGTPGFRQRLRAGIEAGAITGIVLEAYPTERQVWTMAQNQPMTTLPSELRGLPVVDFWAKHFQARGGGIVDADNGLVRWRKMKWSRSPAEPLWKLFADQRGHTLHDYLHQNGARTQAYDEDHAAVYAALPAQPTLVEVLGTAHLVFTNTEQVVASTRPILGARGVTSLTHGEGLSFVRLLSEQVDTLTPSEHLALATTVSTPEDTNTYLDMDTWSTLAGVDPTVAAGAYSDSVGLYLDWNVPEYSYSFSRVRSVVR